MANKDISEMSVPELLDLMTDIILTIELKLMERAGE